MTLKVYGWTRGGKTREIIAAHSWAEAAKASGHSRSQITKYGSITRNPEECAMALARPGTVFSRPLNGRVAHTTRPA